MAVMAMSCPSCTAPLIAGDARCSVCGALVAPPAQGALAVAPRPVTPQFSPRPSGPSSDAPTVSPRRPEDEAWRQEVLNRVRRHREARQKRELPLFNTPADASAAAGPAPQPPPLPSDEPLAVAPPPPVEEVTLAEEIVEAPAAEPVFRFPALAPPPSPPMEFRFPQEPRLEPAPAPPAAAEPAARPIASAAPTGIDLDMRPLEPQEPPRRPVDAIEAIESPEDSVPEPAQPSPRAAWKVQPVRRSLVGDAPLVDVAPPAPTPIPNLNLDAPVRPSPAAAPAFRVATLFDRFQAAAIDFGVWMGLVAVAAYFASRVARSSMAGLLDAWPWVALFALVLAVAYAAFFTGLVGATPGKMACGIEVRGVDGRTLGPVLATGRAVLGVIGVAALGLGMLPALTDRDARGLHDRLARSRVLFR